MKSIVKELSITLSSESTENSDVDSALSPEIVTTDTSMKSDSHCLNSRSQMEYFDYQNHYSTSHQLKHQSWKPNIQRAYSPNLCENRFRNKSNTLALRPSVSVDNLFNMKLDSKPTGDSGTGASIMNLLTPNPIRGPVYDEVCVYGQRKTVLMTGRHNFDRSTVEAYLNQMYITSNELKPKHQPKPSSANGKASHNFFKKIFPIRKKKPKKSGDAHETAQLFVRDHTLNMKKTNFVYKKAELQ